MQTLLPLPVAPAISRCGIFARSATTGSPATLLPRASASLERPASRWNAVLSITLRRATSDVVTLGTSMPTTGLPGTGASIRMEGVARARARSLASDVIWLTRTRVRETSSVFTFGWPLRSKMGRPEPSRSWTVRVLISQPGSMPNCVTVGPSFICATSASTPKLASVSTISRERAALSGRSPVSGPTAASRSSGGIAQPSPGCGGSAASTGSSPGSIASGRDGCQGSTTASLASSATATASGTATPASSAGAVLVRAHIRVSIESGAGGSGSTFVGNRESPTLPPEAPEPLW